MKTLFALLFTLISFSAMAQDSSKIFIRISLNQKHIAYMGYQLKQSNSLNDRKIADTLSRYIGSGNVPDSIITGSFRPDYIKKFIEKLTDEQAGAAYDYFKELVQGRTTPTVWIGLQSQLTTLAAANNGGAIWLKRELLALMARKEAVLTERINIGKSWIKAGVTYE